MPDSATTPHPNLKGSEPRTRLAGGPFVDTTTTLAQFDTWIITGRARRQPISQGIIIDRLTAFALALGYDPVSSTVTPRPGFVVSPEVLQAARDVLVPPSPPKTSPAAPKRARG